MREVVETWNYYACVQQEPNVRLRAIWDRFLAYELGHLHVVMDLFRRTEGRDPLEVIPQSLPDPLEHASQRTWIRRMLRKELEHRGTRSAPKVKGNGLPSEIVAASYRWTPISELASPSRRRRRAA